MFTCPLSGVAYFQNRPDTTTEPPVLFSHCQCTLTRLPFNTNISSNYETLEGKKKNMEQTQLEFTVVER